MRLAIALAAAALLSTPALAQPARQPPAVPEALTDPATADRLARVMQALSQTFLDLPVGEVEAAIAGREPTEADRKRTIRSAERARDPEFERKFRQQIAEARPMMESMMKALAASLPAMMAGMEKAGNELEKGIANLPSPTYPKQ